MFVFFVHATHNGNPRLSALIMKPTGEKCWSISGPNLEADVFTRQFGVGKGDVLVDVLNKRNRDLELSKSEVLEKNAERFLFEFVY